MFSLNRPWWPNGCRSVDIIIQAKTYGHIWLVGRGKVDYVLMSLRDQLTLSWRRPISYRKQSIESMDWFLYDIGLRHERVKIGPSAKFLTSFKRVGEVTFLVKFAILWHCEFDVSIVFKNFGKLEFLSVKVVSVHVGMLRDI